MEEYLDFRDDTGFNSPYLRKSAYFSEKNVQEKTKASSLSRNFIRRP